MSQQEAVLDMYDAPEKPVDLSKLTGEPGRQPSTDIVAALGLPTITTDPNEGEESDPDAQKKADESGKTLVDNYSKAIQDASEELYGTMLYRAKAQEGYLQKLVDSPDKTERRIAKKILERNPEFGASTPEEFRLKLAKQQAGTDPHAQEIVELKHRVDSQDRTLKDAEWQTFKKDNAITGDFASQCDDIRALYPTMPHGHIVATAKGLSSAGTPPTKQAASFAAGGTPPAQIEDAFQSPLAKRLLPNLKDTKKFAREYFGQ